MHQKPKEAIEIQPFIDASNMANTFDNGTDPGLTKRSKLQPNKHVLRQQDIKFPKIEIQKAAIEKKAISSNQATSFLLRLNDKAKSIKIEEENERKRRALADKDQDWGVLKALAGESIFLERIRAMQRQDSLAKPTVLPAIDSNKSSHTVASDGKLTKFKLNSTEQLIDWVRQSPFRKRSLTNHQSLLNDAHSYGKPDSIKIGDFNEVFKDLAELGNFVTKNWNNIHKDELIFSLENIEISKKQNIEVEKMILKKHATETRKKVEFAQEFNHLNDQLRKKLNTLLENRTLDRYFCSENPSIREKLIKDVNLDTNNDRLRSLSPIWKLPHLWQNEY